MVISRKHIAIIDPHRNCIDKDETSPAGKKEKLSTFFEHKGHISTFESIFGLETKNDKYEGTIFRFPLRPSGSNSKISKKSFKPEEIQAKLFESLKEESPYILLFLRNVKSISLMEWIKGSSKPHKTFQVEILDQMVNETSTTSVDALPLCEAFARQCSQGSDTDDSKVYIELKSTTVTVSKYSSTGSCSTESHHWLVLKVVGTCDDKLNKLSKDLSILPWVGLATRFPRKIALRECEARIAKPFNDADIIEAVFEQLKSSLGESQVSIPWSDEGVSDTTGHAYCFLPLPERTAMPVHVHGYFAVTDNRRSIKWPAHDEQGKEAQWNKGLLYEMVAPAYALLLACRAGLICYEDTPLPVANTEHVTDAYSTWPLYPEVKNVPIWNELVSPTVTFSSPLPLLWTSACGGKWVQFSKAYFLPGTFCSTSHGCSPVVFQLLIKVGIPVVCLPKAVCKTIKQNKHLQCSLQRQEISPQLFRQEIKAKPECCQSLSREEVYDALDYALSDIGKRSCNDMINVPLLPLKDKLTVLPFEYRTSGNQRYVFSQKMKSLVHLLQVCADNLIVDPDIPDKITEKLCEIASAGYLQLVEVTTEIMCKQLLPVSVRSWCTKKNEIGWTWTPGVHSMPAQAWLESLWKWVAKNSVSLTLLQNLPIVPLLTSDDSQDHEEVTLVEPVIYKGRLCRLSASFSSKEKSTLIVILKKLEFLIVDETKMKSSDKMKKHPDFKEFIPRLTTSLDLIAQHLAGLSVTSRLQTVQYLLDKEKDFLRKHFSLMSESSVSSYKGCLKSIPIYRAESGTVLDSPRFIALTNQQGIEAFLPYESISDLPIYPDNMLCPASSSDERSFLKLLSVRWLKLPELCKHHLIPLALEHIESTPYSWSVGDELVVWILKQRPLVAQTVLDALSSNDIICTCSNTHTRADEVIDPQDDALAKLFSAESEGDHFPHERYLQERHCRYALLKIGMKTWKTYQAKRTRMCALLLDRMKSIRSLDSSLQLSRGKFILDTLAEPTNDKLRKSNESLFQYKFLKAEMCPTSYPSCLQGMWCGQNDQLYSIDDLYLPDSETDKLVGTSMPILSCDYYSFGRHAMSRRTFEVLPFKKVATTDIRRHLTTLESVTVVSEDAKKFNDTVMCVYERLHISCSGLKLPTVWWKDAETAKFLPAEKFILERPQDLHANLEPHFYVLLKTPLYRYAHNNMFDIHDPLTPADLANMIKEIARQAKDKLTSSEIDTCISVLNWLCRKKHKEADMLMLTADSSLIPAVKCVYDDRNWMKDSRSKGQIKAKSFVFVHDQIPPKVAKYFSVTPLSRKVAPSERLGISYIKAGQHEDITHRIGHIVKDYESNIDIFKELIQNADDAGATKIKFLIDWREHPKESLISEELKEWQGPALIAYNDAKFSDDDFDNICKVAGETKKKDPLKTGRFGVGFCATYHLTDLPSFISRRFFTMFDPHTFYLGDRISAQQPGMRVDLVENQEDLELYLHQFKPYENLFGCKIFHLKDDGYPGTLFRFPFRSSRTSERSKICKTIYDRRRISTLVEMLKEEGEELMLFLKHVDEVSLYELENGCKPSACKKILSVKRKGDLSERMKLISEHTSTTSKTCSSKVDIDVEVGTKKHSHTGWILSSATKSCTDSELVNNPDSVGLLPLAEIALKVTQPKEGNWSCMPVHNTEASKFFCFLPLPIKSQLPFHVNGFFSIGKDRRNITATDDKSFGSQWNKSLAQGALFEAFSNLLVYISDKCDLRSVSSAVVKSLYLSDYYSLWNLNASGLIGETFVSTFKKQVPELGQPLLWSEIDGGRWLPPTEVVVFKDGSEELNKHEAIKKDAVNLLISHGHGLADLPHHPYIILKSSLKSSNRLYNYQKFCKEILFPEIDTIDKEVRLRNMKFLAERFGVYQGNDNWYEWSKEFLVNSPCIPCEGSKNLSPCSELIDPRSEVFKKLFDVCEGRFPSEELQKSYFAMKGLCALGMTSYKLRISDLKNRAETVRKLDHEPAIQRSMLLCTYIKHVYSLDSDVSPSKDLQEISDIPFLPVKQKPDGVNVPWYGKCKTFESPSQVYSSYSQHLVFSQHPVVNLGFEFHEVLKCLGVNLKRPTLSIIISHLKCLIEYTMINKPDDTTLKFLDETMASVCSRLDLHYSEAKDIEQLQQVGKIIWQDGHFLRPDQVVKEWKHSCYPYLSELSSTNKKHCDLMEKLGVKEKPTATMLENILQTIANDFAQKPVDKEVLAFIEYTVSILAFKVQCLHKLSCPLKLPDENRVMREVSHLAENVGDAENTEWLTKLDIYNDFMTSGDCNFVHSSIPRDRAITLGVLPLLQAVVKEIEDDSFLKGTPFGQQEDLCDRLNGILKKYPAGVSIFQEFIQNADDAQATEIAFVLDHRVNFPDSTLVCGDYKWKKLQRTPALCVFNNRKFTETDIEGITKLGRGGKKGAPDLIGKFGIGFNVAYHITDCPSFISYAEDGSPEYLCVFDPTRSFLPISKNDLPGKKWDFEDQRHYSGFSDQFKPYLNEDLPKLLECIPRDLQDRNHGHVLFRLPLTRLSQSSSTSSSNRLDSGANFSLTDLSRLFDEFNASSQDMLLFLNHLRRISVFEIRCDGSYMHRFTTTASVPHSYHSNFAQYSEALKQCNQAIEHGHAMNQVSLPHQMSITCIVTNEKELFSSKHKYQWLVQRTVGGKELKTELLQAGLHQGLRPVGGVATLLEPVPNYEYRLFCFLPLPIESNLPVHVNGHFLVDDSRKHLENSVHKSLQDWNHSVAQNVVVPAYLDLVTTAKQLIFDTDKFDRGIVQQFYSLFPKPIVSVSQSEEKENVGELENLKILHHFYKLLLAQNPNIIVRKPPSSSSPLIWIPLKDCLFYVSVCCDNRRLVPNDQVCTVLVSLGLPIAEAPKFIHTSCSNVEKDFKSSTRIEPKKIIQHLRSITCTDEQKKVIKENIRPFLQYCIAGYNAKEVKYIFNALYLLASDGTLQHGILFQSAFSELLPHCAHNFVDPVLEESEVGKILSKNECGVICPLTLKFVSENIKLTRTSSYCSLDTDNLSIIKLLWKCIANQCVTGTTAKLLKSYFSSIAIIPASDSKLYPVCMARCLVKDALSDKCSNCSVMEKLGYPKVDFDKIGFVDSGNLNVHKNVIDALASCFQNGEDIVNCFQLNEPKNFDVQLSNREVQGFTASLVQLQKERLRPVSKYLLQMPLFQTIDGSWISLSGISKVFILSSTDFPFRAIPAVYKGHVVLNATTPTVSAEFYTKVIPDSMSAQVKPEELYTQLILPILHTLSESEIKKHVRHICMHKNDEMGQAFRELKDVAFIKHHEDFCKVSELYDPNVKFFTVFRKNSVLPATWHDDIPILKDLGLCADVSTTEWLKCAKNLAKRFPIYSISNIEEKSQLLMDILIKKTENRSHGYVTPFLETVADIEFIYCPQEWLLTKILSHESLKQQSSTSNHMVKFRGSVSINEADLACLCKSILPKSCQPLLSNQTLKNSLHIEAPASPETVAENLKRLCSHLNVTCARSLDLKLEHRQQLVTIFGKHYESLSSRKPHSSILNDFKDMMCVLLPSDHVYLQLVKPSQLVTELPSGCLLEPYCYKVTPSLQKYVDFLTAIGVRQKLKAQDYIDIIRDIKNELGDDGIAESDHDKEVIKCAYFETVRCLRQGDSMTGDADFIWLPDQTMKLVKVHSLCFNDAPWYEDRLPQDCGLKMILPPPIDNKGIYSLPKSLNVKLLSEIITEELVESCRSPDLVCNEEELYALGKRSENRRCIFVRKILESLKSKELLHGLCRIYHTEHKVSPSDSFMMSVQKLKKVQIRCIYKIKTVLHVNGQLNASTEDSTKFCYVCKEENTFVLYIAPHEDAPEEDLLLDLAFCIRKLVNNEIRDLTPIAAAFSCEPSFISQILNRHSISSYTLADDKNANTITVGTAVSWGKLNPQDSLIVLNFDPEDPVRYVREDGSLINAEIVKCKPIDHSKMHQFELLEPTLTIKVQEDDKASEHSNDTTDSEDPDDAAASASTIDVSPIQVFKLLSIPQRKSLWGEGTSQFACPVVLASIPFSDFTLLEKWLHIVLESPPFSNCSSHTVKVLALRLLRHIHYLLVIQKKAPLLFNIAALKIQEIQVQIESAYDHDTDQRKDDQMQDVIAKMMENLTLEDNSNNSDTSDEEGTSDSDDGSKKPPQRVNSNTFLNSSLVEMLDGVHGTSTTQVVSNTPPPSTSSGGASASNAAAPSVSQVPPVPQGVHVTQPPASVLSRFTATTKAQRRSRKSQAQASRFQPIIHHAAPGPAAMPYVPPKPKTCMPSATAWLEQAKADFKAAGRLLEVHIIASSSPGADDAPREAEFPALVCFLCHETVEKCIKGVLYAYCGLSSHLVDCGNLVTLHNALESSLHCPKPLFDTIKECVMSVSTHENKSRYPNYQNPPCAPASIYTTEDANEAFLAAKMLIEKLSSEEKFNQVLGDLDQMPARKFVSTLRSMRVDQGKFCVVLY